MAKQKYCVGKKLASLIHCDIIPKQPPLKETSLRRFRDEYERCIKEQFRSDESSASSSMKALPTKPMGRPLLIGEEADKQV